MTAFMYRPTETENHWSKKNHMPTDQAILAKPMAREEVVLSLGHCEENLACKHKRDPAD